jgi:hypothetical protein
MGVDMSLFQTGLVHVLMSVLGSVVVGVGVLMGDMVVLMRGVRVGVCHFAMVVFVRMRPAVAVLLGHRCHLLARNMLYLMVVHPWCRFFADRLQPTVGAVMTGNPGTGVLGVEDRVLDELADVIVLQTVEDGGSVPAGSHKTGHPQLRKVLGNRRRRLAHMLGEFVDGHLAMCQRPEHLHAGGVGQHSENLDYQTGLVVGQPAFAATCMHTQIVAQKSGQGCR